MGIVLSALLQAGHRPLLPFGDGHPYDLAFDQNGELRRVQCKTGRMINGAVYFPTSIWCRDNRWRPYRNDVDYFGVYCPTLTPCTWFRSRMSPIAEHACASSQPRTTRRRVCAGRKTTCSAGRSKSPPRQGKITPRCWRGPGRCPALGARIIRARAARGCSAAGSAPPWHGGGQGFESPQLHREVAGRRLSGRPVPIVMARRGSHVGSQVAGFLQASCRQASCRLPVGFRL